MSTPADKTGDMVDVDPYGDGGFPQFRFRQAPKGLATRRQLRAMGLSPGGQEPVAQLVWRRGARMAWLYRVDLAKAKRVPTLAQERALDRAMAARQTCPSCRRRYTSTSCRLPYCIGCNTCRAGPLAELQLVPRLAPGR
jgi:hypothetical protein